jgi:hypothetical protein
MNGFVNSTLPDRNVPSCNRGHFVNASISSSTAASDFNDSQFKLDVEDRADERAPSRNGNEDGPPTSMRSLSKWSGTGSQTPTAPLRGEGGWSIDKGRDRNREMERERERTITLGVLSGGGNGDDGRTPSPSPRDF